MRITDARQFGRVAVVMGGNSAEREVSLDSGRNVLAALKARGVDAHGIDGIPALLDALRAGHFARVFNILHGRGGEDGVLQGALASLGVPVTGSGVLGSALSMDKIRTKQVWQSLGLPTPRYARLGAGEDIVAAVAKVELPVVVKPSHEGSSVGITRVRKHADIAAAVELAARYDGELLIEQLIDGSEYTVGVLQGAALPSIHIVPKGEFYDYHAKYVAEDTQYICPGLDDAGEREIRVLALAAFDAAGCAGWGRVDFMRDRAGAFFLLEVNTTPGMTSHSLVPKAAGAVGIDFEELCWRILETSFGDGAAP
ncbi:MAG: D-alanine--D-alanine ligase [Xanthomonadaceae bacterium]|nr:D-alanine--D-alanine ligase [Xanthomonadaceae bacterium]MDE2084304.1 D-alanine--D-alanine ligase [Xanthomonadaceae bacterium]